MTATVGQALQVLPERQRYERVVESHCAIAACTHTVMLERGA